jgi:hypothetical protein
LESKAKLSARCLRFKLSALTNLSADVANLTAPAESGIVESTSNGAATEPPPTNTREFGVM